MAVSTKERKGSAPRPVTDWRESLLDWRSRVARYLQSSGANLLMLLTFILVPMLAVIPFIMPSVEPATAPASTFSAERALPHLQAIAEQPRPVGSAANATARDYLLQQLTAIGFQPEVQKAEVLNGEFGAAATVQNVLVRLPGTDSTRAVLITAHYDSAVGAPGVGDNGISIAAMLETLRALRAGPALRNDLIFLFNDGEETGMLGSQAFVEEHPWATDVGVVFDFDADSPAAARTIVSWTTAQDGWLVREMAKASASVVASSIDTVEKRVDAGNDLRIFAAAGITGAHMNVVAGSTQYHSASDNLANLDERRLQDHGNAMLALTRHFGDLSIGDTKGGNNVYFTVFGTRILHYPTSWALPLALIGVFGLVTLVAIGLWRHRLTVRGLALALLVVVVGTIGFAGLSQLGWLALLATHPEARVFSENDFYGRSLYMSSLYAAIVAIVLAATPWLARRFTAFQLAVVSAVMIAALVFLAGLDPTVNYLALLPLLAGLSVLAVLLLTSNEHGRWWSAVRLVAQVLGVIVVLGVTVSIFYRAAVDGLEDGPAFAIAILTLLLGLLTPQLALVARIGRRWLPATGGILALGLLVFAIATSGQSASNPRPDTLAYGLNADTGQALWVSTDSAPDAWTKQFLTETPQHHTIGDLFGAGSTPILTNSAPVAALQGPELVLLDEQRSGDERTLHLRLVSPREAYRYYLLPGPGVELLAAGIEGKPLAAIKSEDLHYDGLPAAGAEITLRVRAIGPVRFIVVDQSSGLPQLPGMTYSPRPDTFIAAPGPEWVQADPTLVSRSIEFQ